MADNVTLNSMSGGSIVAADDISSVFYQRVKVAHGADGSATDTSSASPLPVRQAGATATLTNVNDTASSTTLLSANTDRRGFAIHNDSTSILYVKFGTTASTTSYTVKLAADAYYESPSWCYTGRVDGIWSADASGAARITELAA